MRNNEALWKPRNERDRKIKDNLGLARRAAWQFSNKTSRSYDELYSIALAGLVVAVDRFDESLNNAFSSFAVPYIRGEILHYLERADKAGGISLSHRRLTKAMLNPDGSRPEKKRPRITTLDQSCIAEDLASEQLKDQIKDESYQNSAEWRYMVIDLHLALDRLPREQREAIIAHYLEDIPQVDAAPIIGLTKLSINREIKKGLKSLAEDLAEYRQGYEQELN